MSAIVFPETRLGDDVTLRLIAPADAAEIFSVAALNRAYLAPWMAWLPHTQKVEDITAYITGALEESARGVCVPCVIRRERCIIGTISLHNIDRMHRTAEVGFWLAQDATGRGIMTNAARAMIAFGKATLQLHRIELMAAVENRSSRRVAERLGMQYEATLRERLHLNGRAHDAALYALVAD
jgi:ribosomal-protein-serine acetyltransferase